MKWLLLLIAAFQLQLLIVQGQEQSTVSILGEFGGWHRHVTQSCKRIKQLDPMAPSKMYTINITISRFSSRAQTRIDVYCEMGLDGGGYTFLTPESVVQLQPFELLSLFTDRTRFLLRVRKTDGSQPYAVLKQLPQYADISLKLGLSENIGYNQPVNIYDGSLVGQPYLYFGFLSMESATNNNVQGLQVNGFDNIFLNGDKNPNSHFALFPNFPEANSSTYDVSGIFCDQIFSHLLPNPSGRVMPPQIFMFGETHWGGGGCYKQTDRIPGVLSIAIGIR